ncbi:MAG: amidohydrolase family protein, partial [Chloroflexota bacterium]
VMWQLGVNSGKFSSSRFVELMSTNPAKIFGCYPQKGTIAPGTDADIVVWDPNAKHTISASTHHMRCDYNVYEGMQVTGVPQQVYLRGKRIVDGNIWLGKNGEGKYVRRTPNAPVL